MRWRMTLLFSGASALILFIACWGFIRFSRQAMEHSASILLQSAATKIEKEIAHLEPNETSLHELTEQARELTDENIALQMLDSGGHLVWTSSSQMPVWPWGHRDDWRGTCIRSGSHLIVIGIPWLKHERSLERQSLTLIGLSFFIFLMITVGTGVLVRRTLSPIGGLAAQVRSASVERLHVQLTPPSNDVEIVELVTTLNDLLDRLMESAAARGRFYAAVSHELRTPLQALSGHLELALQRPRSAAEYRAFVEEALAQIRRLTSLVRALLLLNRLEMVPIATCEPIDLVEICERQLHDHAPLANARGLKVDTRLPPFLEIMAPPNHAEMLLRNLIENAMKYASEGGQVRLTLSSNPGGVTLELFNEYVPLCEQEIGRLCEPFYRVESSRSTATGGTGLGLAICKALADASGWQLNLRSVPEGFICSVFFPCDVKRGL